MRRRFGQVISGCLPCATLKEPLCEHYTVFHQEAVLAALWALLGNSIDKASLDFDAWNRRYPATEREGTLHQLFFSSFQILHRSSTGHGRGSLEAAELLQELHQDVTLIRTDCSSLKQRRRAASFGSCRLACQFVFSYSCAHGS